MGSLFSQPIVDKRPLRRRIKLKFVNSKSQTHQISGKEQIDMKLKFNAHRERTFVHMVLLLLEGDGGDFYFSSWNVL